MLKTSALKLFTVANLVTVSLETCSLCSFINMLGGLSSTYQLQQVI